MRDKLRHAHAVLTIVWCVLAVPSVLGLAGLTRRARRR